MANIDYYILASTSEQLHEAFTQNKPIDQNVQIVWMQAVANMIDDSDYNLPDSYFKLASYLNASAVSYLDPCDTSTNFSYGAMFGSLHLYDLIKKKNLQEE